MPKPEPCGKCGAEPQERRHCPHCGEAEWVLQHGAHYMQGAREVLGCSCPAPHTALGRRAGAAKERQAARIKAGKPTWDMRKKPSLRERVRKHDAQLKRQDLGPLEIWVPDTPRFRVECRRQSRLIAADPHEKEMLDWIGQAADTSGWV